MYQNVPSELSWSCPLAGPVTSVGDSTSLLGSVSLAQTPSSDGSALKVPRGSQVISELPCSSVYASGAATGGSFGPTTFALENSDVPAKLVAVAVITCPIAAGASDAANDALPSASAFTNVEPM